MQFLNTCLFYMYLNSGGGEVGEIPCHNVLAIFHDISTTICIFQYLFEPGAKELSVQILLDTSLDSSTSKNKG